MKQIVNLKKQVRIYFTILLLHFLCIVNIFAGKTKVTLEVLDEQSKPIPNTDVVLGFLDKKIKGKTDLEGKITGEGKSGGQVSYLIKKEGYYDSRSRDHIQFKTFVTKMGLLGKYEEYQPWNPTVETILKKIENPVPMYVKSLRTKLPKEAIGKPVGFDLEKGDWVKPFGKGIISDFIFTISGNKVDWEKDENAIHKRSLVITFSNEGDGIQEIIRKSNDNSYFILPVKIAPEGNYLNKWEMISARSNNKTIERKGFNKDQNFIFRVRTKLDKNGNILEAKYGKIYGEFEFACNGKSGRVGFKYYFNPDGTRNLEFDPKRNLFDDPENKRRETIFDP